MSATMSYYELEPRDGSGQKSFYGKAYVLKGRNGTQTLYSYGTPIMSRTASGRYRKIWDGWTGTTGRHIRAFCGMGRREFESLPTHYVLMSERHGRTRHAVTR